MFNQNYSSYIGNSLKYLISQAKIKGLTGEEIIARCRDCEIDGTLFGAISAGYLSAEDLQIENEKLIQLLQQYRIKQTAKTAFWFGTLKKVLDTTGDIPCILLKGMPLSQIFHGELFWRNTNDIDLWVPENQYKEAVSRIKKLGYRCDIQPHEWATNQIHLKHPVWPSVEIHWKLSPPPWRTPSFKYAYQRSVHFHDFGVDVHILSEADMWINLLIHAQQHFFAPKTILDLYGCLERLKPDLSLLDAYGLIPMYSLVQKVLTPDNVQKVLTPDKDLPKSTDESHVIKVFRNLFAEMFINKKMGTLSLGSDSKFEAMIGVFLRALSMILLDGNMYKIRSIGTVLFYGPHRLGSCLNKLVRML